MNVIPIATLLREFPCHGGVGHLRFAALTVAGVVVSVDVLKRQAKAVAGGPSKPLPRTVSKVPPRIGPSAGVTVHSDGNGRKVKAALLENDSDA